MVCPWAQAGGLPGLADAFSNYNTPYLTLLALLTYLPIEPLVAIKALQAIFFLPVLVVVLIANPSGGGGGGLGGGRGPGSGGTGYVFTYNAPTPYAWLPSDAGEVLKVRRPGGRRGGGPEFRRVAASPPR